MNKRVLAAIVLLSVFACKKKDPLEWKKQARAAMEPVSARHKDATLARLAVIETLSLRHRATRHPDLFTLRLHRGNTVLAQLKS